MGWVKEEVWIEKCIVFYEGKSILNIYYNVFVDGE